MKQKSHNTEVTRRKDTQSVKSQEAGFSEVIGLAPHLGRSDQSCLVLPELGNDPCPLSPPEEARGQDSRDRSLGHPCGQQWECGGVQQLQPPREADSWVGRELGDLCAPALPRTGGSPCLSGPQAPLLQNKD